MGEQSFFKNRGPEDTYCMSDVRRDPDLPTQSVKK
jgi:hypothetical protein